MMKLQVLLAVMHKKDSSFLRDFNLKTDAIVVNQCDRYDIQSFQIEKNNVLLMSMNERGVGLSRNTAFMRATGDICLFADEDMEYVDEYPAIIETEFMNNPDADMILFNVPSRNPERPTYHIQRRSRVRTFNSLRYGAVKIAIKTDSARKANLSFSLLFGGGAKYSSGEDSIFVHDAVKRGLKVYTSPQVIGYVGQEDSSWFDGYSDRYFMDKGAFFAALGMRFAYVQALQHVVRKRRTFPKSDLSRIKALKLILQGINKFNKNIID